ncbi:MAG TPA: potassium channel family protein [Candidatus Binatia bacterium]|nr:potassium channel family protein [Candidatus Binatia bacterium]
MDRLLARRHTILLVVIVTTFLVRPLFGEGPVALMVFSVALLALLLLALYTTQVDDLVGDRDVLVHQRRRRWLIAWPLGLVAIAERLYSLVNPSARLLTVAMLCWLAFFAFVTWSLLRTLLKHREVTGETIAMAVSIYLLIGLTWGMLYIALFQQHPDAFSFGGSTVPTPALTPERQSIFPVFIYFSLTTLSTIGFGDILPLSLEARYAAVAEGITGQFYLAILVARLVGLQMSGTAGRNDRAP